MKMSLKEYYTPPKQEIFEEVKRAAIQIWSTYDDTYGYASSKINAIKDLQNIGDNTGYMIAMFDQSNQQRLLQTVETEEAKDYIEKIIY